MATSPTLRVPVPLRPYVFRLIRLWHLQQVDEEIAAIAGAKNFEEAIAVLRERASDSNNA